MWTKRICASVVAASMVVIPVERAQAGDAAKILGATILTLGAAELIRKNKRPYYGGGYVDTAQRQENRQVQSALNYFGYHVGVVDGSIGPRSRAAISQYQAQMGFNPDGGLDVYERQFLLNSHQRALASAHVPPYNQIMATQGPSGLLRSFRNEELGIDTAQRGTYPGGAPAPVPMPAPVPIQPDLRRSEHVAPPTIPVPVPVPPTRSDINMLPSFPAPAISRSMSEHCNEINVLTAANGGISTAERMGDAAFALSEQFCLARTHAISASARIAEGLPGLTEAAIKARCDGLTGVLESRMGTVDSAAPETVLAGISEVLSESGLGAEQALLSGEICLGTGYRSEDAKMAMASALLLSAAGRPAFGEMVSHHLREGFGGKTGAAGVPGQWMARAVDAARQDSRTALGQSADRLAVLSAAQDSGDATPVAALPVFGTSN